MKPIAVAATIFAITGCGSDSKSSTSDKTKETTTENSEFIDSTETTTVEVRWTNSPMKNVLTWCMIEKLKHSFNDKEWKLD